jgi:hypothetical protein
VCGSFCRGLCLFLQPVPHTCACTEGLVGSQRVGGQAQSILSLWEVEIKKKVSRPNYPFLTLCVSQLTLWSMAGGGGLLHGFVCNVSSYKYDGGVHKINNT